MSEENKTIVRRVIEEFFDTEDTDIADEVLAAGYVNRNPSNPKMRGIENVKRSVGEWCAAFLSDTHHAIEDVEAEGAMVAARWTTRATHRGEFMGVPPIGDRVAVRGIGVYRFSGSKIVESWDEYDALGLLRQLGVNSKEEA
jgi:predicted ester cyclase